ncbi:fumarate/nitrate reduction transcriptional regulator Fnr [Flocculibacter collagenilyticus]|uniref:fumarate/nitrate reduction transcriptional regulator Fnr n=1 Tax=Flocculibacter collagenilyticus TaxID=2744479 RepID=UPI0018F52CBD|nr:fumarate/nitrate reduction transcriptional regulator Fnr [Flocculibacter collagenilyticus]
MESNTSHAKAKKISVNCQNCSISELCLPFSLSDDELTKLDDIIERKKPYQKGQYIFAAGEPMKSIYAIRSGSFKSYINTVSGDEQITAFHLPGDIIGFDAIAENKHQSFAEALETSMVCEIPYEILSKLSGDMVKLRQQIMRLMSGEIQNDQTLLMLLNKKTAEERLAAFLTNLSKRFAARGFSDKQFRLTMTRSEIGNYLGLTVETISRLLSKLQKSNVITVDGKLISIINYEQLTAISGISPHCEI